jgi:hypothetical protein
MVYFVNLPTTSWISSKPCYLLLILIKLAFSDELDNFRTIYIQQLTANLRSMRWYLCLFSIMYLFFARIRIAILKVSWSNSLPSRKIFIILLTLKELDVVVYFVPTRSYQQRKYNEITDCCNSRREPYRKTYCKVLSSSPNKMIDRIFNKTCSLLVHLSLLSNLALPENNKSSSSSCSTPSSFWSGFYLVVEFLITLWRHLSGSCTILQAA